MPWFFFHFWAYDLAKKHTIGKHICLTYCLFMQLIGLVAVLAILLWEVMQHYAHQGAFGWMPWSFMDWIELFLTTAAVFVPIMLLIALLPYRYIKKGSEELEAEKKNRAKAASPQQGKENSHESR